MKSLSKSQFTRGTQCLKSLWLYRERKDLQDSMTPDQQAIFDQGTEVGILAQQLFKRGVLIAYGHDQPALALEATQAAMDKGIGIIYEAAFLHDDVLVRADIIRRNTDGSWDLYEVKSTSEIKDVFMTDVAIQGYVLTGTGLKLNRAHLVHIDSSYVRSGPLNVKSFFAVVDVTAATADMAAQVPGQLARMKAAAAAPEPPKIAIGPHCTKPYDCSFIGHCWAHVPEYSVFNLAGARMDKKTELWNAGVKTIPEIPIATKLTAYQAVQRAVAKNGQPQIDMPAIRAFLNTLAYPLHHLDFEAVNLAIPAYDGLRPFQQLPFEASLHVQRERGAPVVHHEFLADGTKDPRKDLINFLLDHVGPQGSVVAYHKSYEGGIIKQLADLVGRSAPDLMSIEQRLWDLAEPFRKAWYAHPAFRGSWSIKKVLPVLVPSMSYSGLAITDGAAAMQAYGRIMTEELPQVNRDIIMADLRTYCAQDTLAMVRILEHLEALDGVAA